MVLILENLKFLVVVTNLISTPCPEPANQIPGLGQIFSSLKKIPRVSRGEILPSLSPNTRGLWAGAQIDFKKIYSLAFNSDGRPADEGELIEKLRNRWGLEVVVASGNKIRQLAETDPIIVFGKSLEPDEDFMRILRNNLSLVQPNPILVKLTDRSSLEALSFEKELQLGSFFPPDEKSNKPRGS